jgi:hypothetical protein
MHQSFSVSISSGLESLGGNGLIVVECVSQCLDLRIQFIELSTTLVSLANANRVLCG